MEFSNLPVRLGWREGSAARDPERTGRGRWENGGNARGGRRIFGEGWNHPCRAVGDDREKRARPLGRRAGAEKVCDHWTPLHRLGRAMIRSRRVLEEVGILRARRGGSARELLSTPHLHRKVV